MMTNRESTPRRGFTLLELTLAVSIFLIVLIPIGQLFLSSTRALSSFAKNAHVTSRAQVVMDRVIDELFTGRFASVTPPIPLESNWIRFEKITDVVNGNPVFGNPLQVELVAMDEDITDGVDNDGDGLVDEGAIRIWEDFPPRGLSPGPEDGPAIIATRLARDGLKFTRSGAILLIDLRVQEILEPGQPATTYELRSGVRMRN